MGGLGIPADPHLFKTLASPEKRETAMRNFTRFSAVTLCFGLALTLAGSGARAADTDGLFPGEPVVDPGPGAEQSRIDSLRTRIAGLEQRIASLESRSGSAPAATTDCCGPALATTDVCGQSAATTTTARRVVLRRYLVPLGTTVGPTVNSTAALSVQGFGSTGVVSGASVLAAPSTFATSAGFTTLAAPVTSLAAPVTTLARAAACSNAATLGTFGATQSTWGAYPTTVYRGTGAVYSNSYTGAALNTGSGVSFLRVR